ncbi:hypothetical protein GCM10020218_034650 [Dactylosporangium vinaceum]
MERAALAGPGEVPPVTAQAATSSTAPAANPALPHQRTGSCGSMSEVRTKPPQPYVSSAPAASAVTCRGVHLVALSHSAAAASQAIPNQNPGHDSGRAKKTPLTTNPRTAVSQIGGGVIAANVRFVANASPSSRSAAAAAPARCEGAATNCSLSRISA